MYKIKLSISLLISLLVLSCTSITAPKNNTKFSVAYVGGEYDGLLLYNNLDTHLTSYDMLDNNSHYEIRSNITHTTGVYVTNIDNTSNRESITSELQIVIYDKKFKCTAYDYRDKIRQFYIFASNEKFVSNKTALKKIKNENTEELVKKAINALMNEKVKCDLKIKIKSLRKSWVIVLRKINLEKNRSNIEKIIFFLKQKENKTLIVNQVNDAIGSFYLLVIRNFAQLNNIKLDFNQKMDEGNNSVNLFGDEKLDIFALTSKTSLDKIIGNKNKKIVFTDYKTFKKYQKLMECINGYNYISDIKYYLENVLNIKESELINFCQSTPSLTYSETSKFLINKENYSKETSIFETTNFIVKIRKAIFDSKSSGDIRESFLNLKEEVKYKKFNFLTY